jgi:hypothetical protein
MQPFSSLTSQWSRVTEAWVQEGAAWLSLLCALAYPISLFLGFSLRIPGWWFEHAPIPIGSAAAVLGTWYLVRPSSVPKSNRAVAVLGVLGGSYVILFIWAWSGGPP